MTSLLRSLFAVIVSAGLVVCIVSVQRIRDRSHLEAEGVMTSGVVQWASATGGSSNNNYRIRVIYRDTAGQPWSRYFTVFSSQYRAGQAVEVVYLPTHPATALLGKSESGVTRAHELIASLVGIMALLVGGVTAAVMHRTGRGRRGVSGLESK